MSLPENIDHTATPLPNRPSEVLIIGGGPVGSAFALDLARRGIDVLVLDPSAEVVFDGRARGLSIRTMEHLRSWGVADEFHAASPIPAEWFGETVFRTSMIGRELWRAPQREPGQQPLSAERMHRLPQNRATRLLRDAAARAGARFGFGWAATSFDQDADGATVTAESASGERRVLRAHYVVAADGSRSVVRRGAGIERDSTPLQGYQYSVIVEVPSLFEAVGMPPHVGNWIFNDELSDAFNPFEIDRYGMSVGPFPEPIDLTDELIGREVARRVGKSLPHRTVAVTTYRMQKRVARTFRLERLLLAGDAAHVFPPTIGMNLNTGIADVGNGAWKLAAVLQGWGGEALLDSYDVERRVAAHRIGDATLEARAALDRRIGYLRGRPIPEGDDAASAAERDEIIATLQRIRTPFAGIDGVTLDQRYDHSGIVVSDGTPASSWDPGRYVPVWRPGHRIPHCVLSDGTALHATFGPGLTVLVRADTETAAAAPIVAAARAGAPLVTIRLDGVVEPDYGPPRRLSLVRPDQTLAWHADETPADPDALIARITGSAHVVHLAPSPTALAAVAG